MKPIITLSQRLFHLSKFIQEWQVNFGERPGRILLAQWVGITRPDRDICALKRLGVIADKGYHRPDMLYEFNDVILTTKQTMDKMAQFVDSPEELRDLLREVVLAKRNNGTH